MTAIAISTRKQRRVALAKMLFQLTVGFGFSFGTSSLMAQHCDQCQARSITGPSCGCETPSCSTQAKKPCIPKPSFAEKIFSHLDKVGDRIELKMKKSAKIGCASRGPNCGCEVAPSCGVEAAPSCGCEVAPTCGCEVAPTCGCEAGPTCGCEVAPTCGYESNMNSTTPYQNTLSSKASPPTNSKNGNPAALGSIGDTKNDPVIHGPGRQGQTAEEKVRTVPKFTSQTPAEDKTSSRAERAKPVFSESKKDNFIDESDSIPSLAPTILPPAAMPPSIPKDRALPDILVDPFKDDASYRKTRDKMEGVLLTSGQRRKPSQTADERKQHDQINSSVPPSLTKGQRNGSQIEFDAIVPSDKNESSVVPTSFRTASAEVIVAKKKQPTIPADESDDTPIVSRMPVPRTR